MTGANAAFVEHGGRLAAARTRFPEAPEPWIDLSTGIAPWPYPIPAIPAEAWTRLPDPADMALLVSAARRAYRVPAMARVTPVPGTDLAIGVLPWLVRPPCEVAIVGPTYGAHEKAWAAAGHGVRLISHPARIGDSRVAVAVNPNNPDGRRWPPALLAETAARLAGREGVLVIDEAFVEASPGLSVLNASADLGNIAVLRSFGKFHGLAGLRLGFVITSHPLGEALASAMGNWPVSGLALAAGRAGLADGAWAEAQRGRLAQSAEALDALLASAGLAVAGGTPLFRLVAHGRAADLFAHLARRGILTRPFAGRALLRFGIPSGPDVFSRIEEALVTWRQGQGKIL